MSVKIFAFLKMVMAFLGWLKIEARQSAFFLVMGSVSFVESLESENAWESAFLGFLKSIVFARSGFLMACAYLGYLSARKSEESLSASALESDFLSKTADIGAWANASPKMTDVLEKAIDGAIALGSEMGDR